MAATAPTSEKPRIELPESSVLKLTVFFMPWPFQFSDSVDEMAMVTKTFGMIKFVRLICWSRLSEMPNW